MTPKRLQTGQLIESSDFIYIRFYRDGKRVAEKAVPVDDKHYSAKARTVKMLQAQFMATVNRPAVPSSAISVPDFYEAHYVPYIESVLKPSSIHGYKKLWDGVLSDHFKNRTLADYKTIDSSVASAPLP